MKLRSDGVIPMVKIIPKQKFKKNNGEIKPLNESSLKKSLGDNIKILKEILKDDQSIIYRNFEIQDSTECTIIFVDGMVDREVINENILEPLMNTFISEISDKSRFPIIS